MFQSQQRRNTTDIQEDEIEMSINVLYVQGTSETLWPIVRSLKIRSTFSAKRTMRKAFCQPKDRVATDVLRSRYIISILIQQFPIHKVSI